MSEAPQYYAVGQKVFARMHVHALTLISNT